MVTLRVLDSKITRASVEKVDIGGVSHKVECSTVKKELDIQLNNKSPFAV